MASADRVSRVFGALADPTRRAILARLTRGEATVSELAAPFDISLPAVSRHIRVLQAAGLVSRTRLATTRFSHLEPEPLGEVVDWLIEISAAAHAYGWPQDETARRPQAPSAPAELRAPAGGS
jgi:DNA-binding transcriptional ArsR family regulator